MLAGLSGRRYQQALEPVGERVEQSASGTSQSSVSRRFITATAERLAEFRSRPLDDQRWLICFVDGFDFAGHTMVGALGVTADGTKVPLGVVEGSTENASVVRGLIAWLRDRGLDASEGVLFVLDGGKALAKAVRDVFGDHAVIARCRLHKERNVLDHLPEAERPWVRRKLRAAWANPDAGEAEAALRRSPASSSKVEPRRGRQPARRPRRDAHRHPPRRHRLAAEDGDEHEPGRVDDRDRPRPRPQRHAAACSVAVPIARKRRMRSSSGGCVRNIRVRRSGSKGSTV